MVVFSSCTNGGPTHRASSGVAPQWSSRCSTLPIWHFCQWSRRMDHFGDSLALCRARGEGNTHWAGSSPDWPAMLTGDAAEIAPFKTAALLDKLGQTLGESDTLVWRMAAHALKLLGSEARYASTMTWTSSGRAIHCVCSITCMSHLDRCIGPERSLKTWRAPLQHWFARIPRTQRATKARHAAASEHPTLADSLICAAEKWRQEVIDAVNQERPLPRKWTSHVQSHLLATLMRL